MCLNNISYFDLTIKYYQFIFLKKISLQKVELPMESEDKEFLKSLSFVHIQDFISDKLVEKYLEGDTSYLRLTKKGELELKKHYIDYQLDILKLENITGDYFYDLIRELKEEKIQKVALYGASDTTYSMYKYLSNNDIEIACVLDDEKSKHGGGIYNSKIISPSDLDEYCVDAIVISTVQFQEELHKKAQLVYGNKYRIIKLFR